MRNELTHHSNEEIVGHCKNMYCPLLYLKPFGFDMIKLRTSPGSTETCIGRKINSFVSFYHFYSINSLLDGKIMG